VGELNGSRYSHLAADSDFIHIHATILHCWIDRWICQGLTGTTSYLAELLDGNQRDGSATKEVGVRSQIGVWQEENYEMDLGIAGKTALVAASSMGLGRACAEALACEGVHVAICGRGERNLLKAVEDMRRNHRVNILGVKADVSKVQDLKILVERVNSELGMPDILVNNAGGPPYAYFDQITDADWDQALQLNLFSAVRLTRLVLPEMTNKKWGRIINITSMAAKEPVDGMMLSNSVRAAVHGFAKTLSREVAAYGITVNCVLPGSTRTTRIENLARVKAKQMQISFEAALKSYADPIPVGRLGEPSELGDLVAYLSSQQASFITGTSILVDGGTLRFVF
jgi:3-oxoacyl-[acyl-carrier protein] reductase